MWEFGFDFRHLGQRSMGMGNPVSSSDQTNGCWGWTTSELDGRGGAMDARCSGDGDRRDGIGGAQHSTARYSWLVRAQLIRLVESVWDG